jgi:hypothetical protein
MVKKLSLKEQRALLKSLPSHRMAAVKKHCQSCQMKGQGIGSILKSIGKFLGPIVKELGPTVLKELVIPFIKTKIGGGGIHLPGGSLRLAGQRGHKGKGKKAYKMPKEYYM